MSPNQSTVPLIVDTDMAPDDWVAILYLGLRNDIKLNAITVSGTGEAHGKKGAKNCLRLLKMINKAHIPVAFGESEPLRHSHHFPRIMRFAVDRRMFIKFPKNNREPESIDAVELLKKVLISSEEEETNILALGPLTNIANLIKKYPQVKSKIAKIYIMGGAVDVSGNIDHVSRRIDNSYAEWNVYCDPHAANVVFESNIPIFLVPLDATDKIPINKKFIQHLQSHKDNIICEFMLKIIKRFGISRIEERSIAFWDLIAAMCVNSEEIADTEFRQLRVIEKEGPQSGRIIEDPEKGTKIEVCKEVEENEYFTRFFRTILS